MTEDPFAGRPRRLRLGLPRDPASGRYLTGFFVVTVTTVLLVRGLLAATGYPQVGGAGLHVAHVLWGGLAMALAVIVLLSFVGPTARPLAAVLAGIGFGLFVDEVGKFVTSDNDYFFAPTAAIVYVVVVALVLVAEALHGRREHHPSEYLAGAVDRAAAGIAGGFTARARAEARHLAERGSGAPGAEEVAALVDAVVDDDAELVDPVAALGSRVQGVARRMLAARRLPWVLLALTALTVGAETVLGLLANEGVTRWVAVGLLASSALVLVAMVLAGAAALRGEATAAWDWLYRGTLVGLLLVQVCAFRALSWPAAGGAVVLLAVYVLADQARDGVGADDVGHRRTAGERTVSRGRPEVR
ncbi:hypothetical protein [Cellulomonas sp. PhB143]|uniref:hypothetical protein n=1 Tax=Cellulomonas sp. PhB143 TaxID=2485186 RepID=UPI000FB1B9E5|nr:hypothetical protein [Cellulomonas sp. PhB143]ROS74450.1 hypothetical protein EDF32_2195 [Cellulomonas sp. PhB143]